MPFKGFSCFRLKEHFRKSWPIYLVGGIICAVLSNLLFTITAPQVPYEEQVLIYFVDTYPDVDKLTCMQDTLLEYGVTQVDETLREVRLESIDYNDPEQDMYSTYVIVARMSVGDGDIYIANSTAGRYLLGAGIAEPLDTYLAEGWMSEFDLTPIELEDTDTGEVCIAALSLDNYEPLKSLDVMKDMEGAMLIVAANGTNIETSMAVTEQLFRTFEDGSCAEMIAAIGSENAQ